MGFGRDPGPCGICGAAHSSCGGGPIELVQLPARDAAAAAAARDAVSIEVRPGIFVAKPLGDGSDGKPFSTGTYRGDGRRRRKV